MALKGHTRIELTNVETGEVEVHEDNNMITNALSKLLGNYGIFCNNPLGEALGGLNLSDTIMRLTGGLMLFDTAIEENPEIINAPVGVSVVGCGSAEAYSGANIMAGSYNSEESGYTEDGGYKHVWDFSTSQANGNIACASLTTNAGGKITEGTYPFSSDYFWGVGSNKNNEVLFTYNDVAKRVKFYNDVTSGKYILFADGINNRLYIPATKEEVAPYRHTGTSTTDYENFKKSIFYKKSIDIDFYRFGFGNFSIFDSNYPDNTVGSDKDYLGSITVEMPDGLKNILTQEILNTSGLYWNVQTLADENNIYLILRYRNSNTGNILVGESIYIWEINSETFESNYYSVKNLTDEAFYINSPLTDVFENLPRSMLISGDTIIFYGATTRKIYLVSKTTNATYTLTTPDGEEYVSNLAEHSYGYSANGKIIIQTSTTSNTKSRCGVIDTNTKHITFKNIEFNNLIGNTHSSVSSYYKYLKVKGKHYCIFIYYSSPYSGITLYFDPTLLVTINNLETPVQKTSAQTMKVTYVLTQE